MFTDKYIFHIKMAVRDYELDYQGIVNNANYLHYLEHTRHEFCRQAGMTFKEMHLTGIDPVLAHADIHYHQPLRGDQEFFSCLNFARKGPRFQFIQDLYLPDGTSVLKATITIACIEDGQLTRGDRLAKVFEKYI